MSCGELTGDLKTNRGGKFDETCGVCICICKEIKKYKN